MPLAGRSRRNGKDHRGRLRASLMIGSASPDDVRLVALCPPSRGASPPSAIPVILLDDALPLDENSPPTPAPPPGAAGSGPRRSRPEGARPAACRRLPRALPDVHRRYEEGDAQ